MSVFSKSLAEAVQNGELDRLIGKYSTSAPRYTSYPTAVEFNDSFDAAEWETQLAGITSDVPCSLYFHIPFCESLCYFCACNKIISQDRAVTGPYLASLLEEIGLYRNRVPRDVPIEQIHWGGGSPNYLKPDEMKQLQESCLEAFPNLIAGADVSVEIDPRTTSVEQLRTLVALRFNRVSLGVQDFDPTVQRLVNRIQPFELTRDIIHAAREEGFSGVNVDLIYGLPSQTVEGFQKTVERVIELRPERIALYGYAHVTWIKKVQKALERAHLPTPAERIAIFSEAIRQFDQAGYVHVGMDHFALPSDPLALALESGRLNRNFMGYTTHRGARLLGMGVSAISSLPQCFAQNFKDIAAYQRCIAAGELPTERGLWLTPTDRMRGEIIEGILCRGEIDFDRLQNVERCDWQKTFSDSRPQFDEFERDGLVQVRGNTMALTEVGRIFARNVAMAFDEYLPKHRGIPRQVFSQAV